MCYRSRLHQRTLKPCENMTHPDVRLAAQPVEKDTLGRPVTLILVQGKNLDGLAFGRCLLLESPANEEKKKKKEKKKKPQKKNQKEKRKLRVRKMNEACITIP
jgi:hypothetical protein